MRVKGTEFAGPGSFSGIIRANRATSINVIGFRHEIGISLAQYSHARNLGSRVEAQVAKTGKRRNRWLELIAVYKLLQAFLLVSVGFGALRLVGKDVGDLLTNLAQELHYHTEGRLINFLLDQASLVDDRMLRRISIFVFCYAAVGLAEGIGLILEKVWAEYFTAFVTASFLPIEIIEIFHRITWFRVGLFVANLAVLVYLMAHLLRSRPGMYPTPEEPESSK